MKIGVIQATSQKDKNHLLYECVVNATKNYEHEVINFKKNIKERSETL